MDELEQALTCTLEGDQLVARRKAWQQVVSRATNRCVEDSRVKATYPMDAQLLQELRDLIAAEADCCPFLDFRLEERPDCIVTELRLPEEMPAPMRTLILDLMAQPLHTDGR